MTRKTRRTTASWFPSWAPVEVIDQLNEHRALAKHYAKNDRRRDGPDMLCRLLTYEGMQKVWVALQSSQKLFPATVFAGSACHGFSGPLDEARLTPAEHRAFLADVQKRCEELSKLLYGSDLDHRLIARLELPLRPEVGRAYWRYFSEILDSVASGAKYYAAPSAAKRAHGKYARRAYFVRHLTGFFREYLGRPRRDLVVIATATAFPEVAPLDQRHVTRLAP